MGVAAGASLPLAVRYLRRPRSPVTIWDRLNEEFISYTHTGWCKNLETLIRQGIMLSSDLSDADREALEARWRDACEQFDGAVAAKLHTIAELGLSLEETRSPARDLMAGLRRLQRARRGRPEEIAAGARELRQTVDRIAAIVEARLSCQVDVAARTAFRAIKPDLDAAGIAGVFDTDAVAGCFVRIREHELVMVLQDLLRNAAEAVAGRAARPRSSCWPTPTSAGSIRHPRQRPRPGRRDPEQLCQAGFTTKAGGSGYGLFHARKTLGIYRGVLGLADRPEGGTAVVPLPACVPCTLEPISRGSRHDRCLDRRAPGAHATAAPCAHRRRRSGLRRGHRHGARPRMRGQVPGRSRRGPRALYRDGWPDVVLLDIEFPDHDGLEVLQELQAIDAGIPVVMLTSHTGIPLVVAAMRAGAVNFVAKAQTSPDIVQETVRHAVRQMAARRRLHYLEHQLDEIKGTGHTQVLGDSQASARLQANLEMAAKADVDVLILGETGTGKELAARWIHQNSRRAGGPFVAEDLCSIPETLLGSALFGHEKGAFTGAVSRRIGAFEAARDGTLMLDEIGEIPVGTQASLLRVLQNREVHRLGSDPKAGVRCDVRVIAATHRDLEAMVADHEFRQDLYYRLKVLTVRMPPLRERRDDIPLLVEHFVAKHKVATGTSVERVAPAAMNRLQEYHWPGNIRNLEHTLQEALLRARGRELEAADVDLALGLEPRADEPGATGEDVFLAYHEARQRTMTVWQRDYLLEALRRVRQRGQPGRSPRGHLPDQLPQHDAQAGPGAAPRPALTGISHTDDPRSSRDDRGFVRLDDLSGGHGVAGGDLEETRWEADSANRDDHARCRPTFFILLYMNSLWD